MTLRLNGSTSGYVEIDAPAVAGDNTLTLPSTPNGSLVALDSSGRLGIGTSSPTQKLSINGNLQFEANDGITIGAKESLSVNLNSSGGQSNRVFQVNDNGTARLTVQQAGNVGIGTTAPQHSLSLLQGNALGWVSGAGNAKQKIEATGSDGLDFYTGSTSTLRMRIDSFGSVLINTSSNPFSFTGTIIAPNIYSTHTTAAAANLHIATQGIFYRSTSSIKYKTDVETMQDSYADAILNSRPVWYKSTCKADNPDWGYWGFIAEEIAEIDPRLVHWKTTEQVVQENGSSESMPCDPEPEGVQYDRFVPHLVNLIKRQQQAIETLEARITALEVTP